MIDHFYHLPKTLSWLPFGDVDILAQAPMANEK